MATTTKPPCPFCGAEWIRMSERSTTRTMRHSDDCKVTKAIARGDDVWYSLSGIPEIVSKEEANRRRERYRTVESDKIRVEQ